MNKLSIITSIAMLFLSASCYSQEKISKPITHTFLAADYGGNKVCLVNPKGDIVWQYPVDKPIDVWQQPNGNLLFTYRRGAIEITREKKIVWEYKVEKPNEVYSCQPLKDGNYMVAVLGPCELREIDKTGKVTKTVKLKTSLQKKIHGQMRIARKLKNGNYIVGHQSEKVIREYDKDGKVIREIRLKGNWGAFAGYRLPNGNTLIAAGDGHKIVEIDKNDKVVWQVKENDLEGNPLRFIAGMQRLANGNTIVANWGGHGHVGEQPQIFEVTPDKKVVWQVFDNKKFKTIAGVKILDEKVIAE